MKHLLTLHDWSTEDIMSTLDLADKLKYEQKNGIEHHLLKGKTLGMIFTKSSTRTRVSFEVGMYQLGGQALFLSSNDIQLGRGETIYDTANVLSRFLDGIMIRTFKQSDVCDLAKYGQIPIINGLTDLVHPCQILADFQTIREHKGKLKRLGNAANKCAKRCCAYDTNGRFPFCGFSSLDHRQRRTRNAKHHTGEKARHIHTHRPGNICRGLPAPIGSQITQTNGVKPKYIVKGVVQTGGDQQTVQKCVNTCTNSIDAYNSIANSNQCTKDDRPYKKQNCGNDNGNKAGHNGNRAFSREE